MEVKDDAVDIKLKASVSGFLGTTNSWQEADSLHQAQNGIRRLVEDHEQQMEELASFDRERWKDVLRRRVVDKGWGRKRTLDEIRDYFELTDTELEFIEFCIEVFRKVRLDGYSEERAEFLVRHDRDDLQTTITEVVRNGAPR